MLETRLVEIHEASRPRALGGAWTPRRGPAAVTPWWEKASAWANARETRRAETAMYRRCTTLLCIAAPFGVSKESDGYEKSVEIFVSSISWMGMLLLDCIAGRRRLTFVQFYMILS